MIDVYTIHEKLNEQLEDARSKIHSAPQQAIEIAESVAEKSDAFQLVTLKGHALHIMTTACRTLGRQVEAIDYVTEAIEIFEQFSDFNMLAELHRWYGVLQFYSGAYPASLGQFIIGRNYAIRTDNFKEIVRAQNCIGEVYRKAGDYALALEAYHSGVDTGTSNAVEEGLGHLYSNIGEVHTASGNYSAALEAYENARQYIETSQDILLGFEWHYRSGKLQMQLGNYKRAHENIDASIRLLKSLSNQYYILDALLLKYDLLMREGQEDQAMEIIKSAEEISQAGGSDHQLSIIYEKMFQFFEKNGYYKKALEYHKRYQFTLQKIEATNLIVKLKLLEKQQDSKDENVRTNSIHSFIDNEMRNEQLRLEMLSDDMSVAVSKSQSMS